MGFQEYDTLASLSRMICLRGVNFSKMESNPCVLVVHSARDNMMDSCVS
jgi:hypothetical protein